MKSYKQFNEKIVINDNDIIKITYKLHNELCVFLEDNKGTEYSVSPKFNNDITALSFDKISSKWSSSTLFVIKMSFVNDNKLKNDQLKTKFKLTIDTSYTNTKNDEFVFNLIKYLNEIFKSHSYFNKSDKHYNHGYNYTFFINTSEIDNIIEDLNIDNFKIFNDSNKYNL